MIIHMIIPNPDFPKVGNFMYNKENTYWKFWVPFKYKVVYDDKYPHFL